MPTRDWAKVPAGLFHYFHQRWAVSICDALNAGRLPDGFYALLEQHSGVLIPEVITLERASPIADRLFPSGGLAVAERPPNTRFVSQSAGEDLYAAKADRIAIRHPLGDIVSRTCRSSCVPASTCSLRLRRRTFRRGKAARSVSVNWS
jgi:hypothetical protein